MNKRFKEIYDIIFSFKYSDENFLELISLVKEAKKIAESIDPNRLNYPCLNNIVQTYNKQVKSMLEKGISKEERKYRFEEALKNFRADLSMFCIESFDL